MHKIRVTDDGQDTLHWPLHRPASRDSEGRALPLSREALKGVLSLSLSLSRDINGSAFISPFPLPQETRNDLPKGDERGPLRRVQTEHYWISDGGV